LKVGKATKAIAADLVQPQAKRQREEWRKRGGGGGASKGPSRFRNNLAEGKWGREKKLKSKKLERQRWPVYGGGACGDDWGERGREEKPAGKGVGLVNFLHTAIQGRKGCNGKGLKKKVGVERVAQKGHHGEFATRDKKS